MNIIFYFDMAFRIYYWLLVVRIVMSWFRLPSSGIFQLIWDFTYDLTEPFLSFFRRLMPPAMVGAVGIDFSPIVAIVVLNFAYGRIIRPILLGILSSL